MNIILYMNEPDSTRNGTEGMTEKRNRIQCMLPGLIVALGAVLRIPVLLHPHLGMEDLYAVGLKGAGAVDLINSAYTSGLPPVFLLFFSNWARISTAAWWLIIPPMVLNLGSIVLMFSAGKKLGGEVCGYISAFIMAVSPALIVASSRTRYEGFALISCAMSIFFAYCVLNDKKSWASVPSLIFSCTLAIYSFYYSFYLLMALNIYFLISRKNVVPWIVSQVGIVVLYIPWVPYFLAQVSGKTNLNGGSDSAYGLHLSLKAAFFNTVDFVVASFTGEHFSLHDDTFVSRIGFLSVLCIIVMTFVGTVLIMANRNSTMKKPVLYAAIVFVSSICFAVFMYVFKNIYFYPRYGIVFMPAMVLLLGLVSSEMGRKFMISLLLLITFAASSSLSVYYKVICLPNGTNQIMGMIWENEKDGDTILIYPPFYAHELDYYYHGKLDISGIPENHDMINNTYGAGAKRDDYIECLKKHSSVSRIWLLLPSEGSFPSEEAILIINELETLGFRPVVRKEYRATTIPECTGVMMLFESDASDGKLY